MTSNGKPSRSLCSCIMVTTDGNNFFKNAQNLEEILFKQKHTEHRHNLQLLGV